MAYGRKCCASILQTVWEAVAFLGETYRKWRTALGTRDQEDALKVGLRRYPLFPGYSPLAG